MHTWDPDTLWGGTLLSLHSCSQVALGLESGIKGLQVKSWLHDVARGIVCIA